jgi:hypothetical protein
MLAVKQTQQGSRGRSPCAGGLGGVPPVISLSRAEQRDSDAQRPLHVISLDRSKPTPSSMKAGWAFSLGRLTLC